MRNSQTSTVSDAVEILQHMSIRSEPGLYVLGSYEDRVTIHSQQIRAFNLIFALIEVGQLNADTKIAIIGAGIAGMSAAVSAASKGATVHVFERHSQVLHNIRGCHTRYLHPNVYDWPESGSLNHMTNLPFLNWNADTADMVAAKLLREWETLVTTYGISTHMSASIMFHQHLDGKRRITEKSAVLGYKDFDIVILATGFGVESTIAPQPLRSYWRDDSMHQPEIEIRNVRTRYLVSGNGDGGLIDILRLRLCDFRHENLLEDFCSEGELDEIAEQLIKAENEIQYQGMSGADAGSRILLSYEELQVPSSIKAKLKSKLRSDTHVTFNFPLHPFTHRSSILHRFLVFVLLQVDEALAGQPGKLISLQGHEPSVEATFATYNGNTTEVFNRVVVRHGPNPAIARDFPSCHATLEPVLRARNATDITRRPRWLDTTFSRRQSDAESVTATDPSSTAGEEAMAGSVLPEESRVASLRSALQRGGVASLSEKLNLLKKEEQADLLAKLTADSEKNEGVLRNIKNFLEAVTLDSGLVARCITTMVTDAVFSDSVTRKARVLEFGAAWLLNAPEPALDSLFGDVIRIIRNDQFAEVNLLVSPLVQSQGAIPDNLHWKYVETLLLQSQSNSHYGAPAAQRGLAELTTDIMLSIRPHITTTTLSRIELRTGLRILLQTALAQLTFDDRRTMLDDFLNLEHFSFMQKYSSAGSVT